jgi:hypothetical protein
MRALAGAVIVVLATAGAGDAGQNFRDPRGDAHGAPDITGVFVLSFPSGRVMVEPTAPAAGRTGRSVFLEIDSDRSARTGSPDGFEYRLAFDLGTDTHTWQHWSGSRFAAVRSAAVRAVDPRGPCCVPALYFTRKAIGGGGSFAFRLTSVRTAGGMTIGRDHAPNRGRWTYSPAGSSGGSPSIELAEPNSATFPGPIHAGKPFLISALVQTNAKTLTVACRGHVGALQVPMKGSYGSQTATCSGVLPAGTAGKQLLGTMRAAAGSTSDSATFAVAIGA